MAGGSIYVGFGDYGTNTGPNDVLRLDLTSQALTVEASLGTEQTWAYREFGGKIYAPYM